MTETSQPSRPGLIERMRDAAVEQIREQQAEHRRIADIVLPHRPTALHRTRERVTNVIHLGTDHLVEVTNGDEVTWTFVIDGKRTSWRHRRQEDAILHLIATRYDDNPNSNINAAFYAGRVLGLPDSDDA